MPKQIDKAKNKKLASKLKTKTFINSANGKLAGGSKLATMNHYVSQKEKQLKNLQFQKNVQKLRTESAKTALKKLTGNSAVRYVNSSIAGVNKAMKQNTNTAKSLGSIAKNIANSSVNSSKKIGRDNGTFNSTWSSTLQDIADKNNAISIGMNKENNQFNANQALVQRNWEEMMSNTAHQREVADLKAAGLNPILSAGGMGAATPSGSAASANNFTGVDTSMIGALAELASNAMHANATMTAAQTAANAQMQSARISGDYNYRSAVQAAAANIASSNIAAGASMYGADANRAAMMYGADQSRLSSRYTSDTSYKGTKYTADKQRGNTWIQTVGNILGNLGLAYFR